MQERDVGRRRESFEALKAVVDDPDRELARLDPDELLAEFVHNVVLPHSTSATGLAVPNVRAGEVLELEGDVLGHVTGPGPVTETGQEPAPPVQRAGVVLERRDPRHEAIHESRDRVARILLEGPKVHEHPDDRRT